MKKIRIKALKFLVNTLGRLSDGINISFQYGFISGKMLDYIYRNQPSGKLLVGKVIDYIYLRHRGWESVRIRKKYLEECLEEAIIEKLKDDRKILIVDVASGPAKYILDTMKKFNDQSIMVICRDLDERWLEEGKSNAAALGLKNICFEKGNAFDEASFEQLPAKPDIIVSSGFYDWLVDDNLVRKSMQIIAKNLKKGGFFIFTNQSGHVDLEMVSEVFVDFNKESLKMTTRSPIKVNEWAKAEGFSIIKTKSDKWGYYSVTLAKKQVL